MDTSDKPDTSSSPPAAQIGSEPGQGNWAMRLGSKLREAAIWLCSAMFAAVFLIFCFKIAARYTGHDAAWADELSVILFIWILFIANGFIVEERRQITFDLIFKHLTGKTRTVVELSRLLLLLGIFGAAFPGAVDYIQFLFRERTTVMNWRLDMVYACFGLFMAAMIVRLAWRLVAIIAPAARRIF